MNFGRELPMHGALLAIITLVAVGFAASCSGSLNNENGDGRMNGAASSSSRDVQKGIASDSRMIPGQSAGLKMRRGAGSLGAIAMLPVTLQFVVAMIAYAINDRMARRVDYLREEVLVLKEALAAATGKTRIDLSAEQRRRLALKGKELTAEERRACCQIVRPQTILAWLRQLAAQKYDSSKARQVGRPRKAADIRKLVLELARDNPGWGYTRIRDALRGLQVEIGRTTVANILAEAGIEPAPERNRKRTWKQFLTSHWETLYACDFFSVDVLGVFGTVRYMVFFVIEVKSRAVQIAGVRIAPDGDWMKQIARNLLDPADGFLRHATHLVVPVGTALSGRPPDRAPQADFPHEAPTFGLRASEASNGPGVYDARFRKRIAGFESLRLLHRPSGTLASPL